VSGEQYRGDRAEGEFHTAISTAERPKVKPEQERKATATENLPSSWINLLPSHLLRYRRYPSEAQARGEQGVVLVSFNVDRDGHVLPRHRGA
jgi:protein TonB